MAGTNTEASDAPRSCMRRVAATNNPAKKGAQVNTSQGNQENGDEELKRPRCLASTSSPILRSGDASDGCPTPRWMLLA